MEPVKAVFRRRDKIEAAVWGFLSRCARVDGHALTQITNLALAELPERCRYDTLFRTFSALLNAVPDRRTVRTYAFAVAANVPALRADDPVVPGRVSARAARVLLQITGARKRTTFKTRETVAQYRGRILVGPGCPADVEWRWSTKYVGYLATHPTGFGFDRPVRSGRAPKPDLLFYRHFQSLVGLRFTADVRTEADRVKIENPACAGSLRTFNRALAAVRARIGFACPFAYTHPCDACPKGQTSCPAACRAADLVPTKCTCGATFDVDPAWPEPACDACRTKNRGPK